LIWHKAQGINGISPKILKVLNKDNRRVLFEFMKVWMEDEDVIYNEWKQPRLVPLPKKGDIHNLNNFHCINLLDMISKVMSIILNSRAQKLLETNGDPMQFGATPKVGCSKAVFSLKIILQSRREYGLDMYAVFIDLVKAYNSIKHNVISIALRKNRAPEKYIKWVEKLYGDFEVILKVGREEIAIQYRCGIR